LCPIGSDKLANTACPHRAENFQSWFSAQGLQDASFDFFPMGGILRAGGALTSRLGRVAIGATGEVGEAALRQLGGESHKFFRTSRGARFVDQFVDGVAHESKVGYTSLTAFVRRQIDKDIELIQGTSAESVVWHFLKSPVTGLGGPSGPLEKALRKAGIDILLHF
jgi:hypothetical protein